MQKNRAHFKNIQRWSFFFVFCFFLLYLLTAEKLFNQYGYSSTCKVSRKGRKCARQYCCSQDVSTLTSVAQLGICYLTCQGMELLAPCHFLCEIFPFGCWLPLYLCSLRSHSIQFILPAFSSSLWEIVDSKDLCFCLCSLFFLLLIFLSLKPSLSLHSFNKLSLIMPLIPYVAFAFLYCVIRIRILKVPRKKITDSFTSKQTKVQRF